jgi:hypothetical protein
LVWIEDDWGRNRLESRMVFPPLPPPRIRRQQANEDNYDAIAMKSLPEHRMVETCVTTYTALRKRVVSCNNAWNSFPCVITICKNRIHVKRRRARAIDISNKNILMNCQLQNSKRCKIDGRGISRIFYGSNTNVTFRNIIFMNGYSANGGGALLAKNGSTINLVNCSIVRSSALNGGAMKIQNSTLTVTHSSFNNNDGSGPPLESYTSDLYLMHTLFVGNKRTQLVCIELLHLLRINRLQCYIC